MSAADALPLWLPPKPAIIRPAEHSLLRPGAFRPMSREERRAAIGELVRSGRLTLAEAKRAMFFVPILATKKATAKSPTLTYIGKASANASANHASPTSFSSVPIGTAASDRLVIVAVAACKSNAGSCTCSAITIGGNNVTGIVTANAQGIAAIGYLVVTSGTTATITESLSTGNQDYSEIFIYTLTGYSSATPYNSNTAGDNSNSHTSYSASLSIPTGGVVVAAAEISYGPSSSGFAFSGAGVTLDDSETSTNTKGFCGSANPATAFGSQSIAFSWSGTSYGAIALASWS